MARDAQEVRMQTPQDYFREEYRRLGEIEDGITLSPEDNRRQAAYAIIVRKCQGQLQVLISFPDRLNEPHFWADKRPVETIIKADGRIVRQRRGTGNLPGGGMYDLEDTETSSPKKEGPKQAIFREVTEETGLDTLIFLDTKGFSEETTSKEFHPDPQMSHFRFVTLDSTQVPQASYEVKKHVWVNLDVAARHRVVHPTVQCILQKVQKEYTYQLLAELPETATFMDLPHVA